MKEAIALACDKHAGVTDKGGKPYFLHVLRVALKVLPYGEDYFITGILHDLVEDTDVTNDYIREVWGDAVAYAVASVTRIEHPTKETYMDFVRRSAQNKIGRKVKLADLDDNSDPERIACLPIEQQDIVKRYERARKVILAAEADERKVILAAKADEEARLAAIRHEQMLIDGGGA